MDLPLYSLLSNYFDDLNLIKIVEQYLLDPLIFIVQVKDLGSSSITFWTYGGRNVHIDWDDGTRSKKDQHYQSLVHQYTEVGTYTCRLYGNCDEILFRANNILTEVLTYGSFTPESIKYVALTALVRVPDYLPPSITTTNQMFRQCDSFNQELHYNMINVTDTSYMFSYCSEYNKPVRFKNFHNVKSTTGMFNECTSFNSEVEIDTRKVITMTKMFRFCHSLNKVIRLKVKSLVNNLEMFEHSTARFEPIRGPEVTVISVKIIKDEDGVVLRLTDYQAGSIDWGDDESDNLKKSVKRIDHEYLKAGEYNITIYGDFGDVALHKY